MSIQGPSPWRQTRANASELRPAPFQGETHGVRVPSKHPPYQAVLVSAKSDALAPEIETVEIEKAVPLGSLRVTFRAGLVTPSLTEPKFSDVVERLATERFKKTCRVSRVPTARSVPPSRSKSAATIPNGSRLAA